MTWVARSLGVGAAGGDVAGPSSSTDNAIARYDGTTGKLLQDSSVTVDDSGNVAGAPSVSVVSGATTKVQLHNTLVALAAEIPFTWSSTGAATATKDTGLKRLEAKGVAFTDGSTGNGYLCLGEVTAPTGTANTAKLYAVDNGAGKTQLVVIFGSGAAQVLATEP